MSSIVIGAEDTKGESSGTDAKAEFGMTPADGRKSGQISYCQMK
jgi:hypothetical protein